jgi:hypothetical protein
MRSQWGIPATAELKAAKILRPGGIFYKLGLSKQDRMEVYRTVMAFQRAEKAYTVFAVCIDKMRLNNRNYDPRTWAWQLALERIHNFAGSGGNDDLVALFPDAGHGYFIRRMVRKMRRHHTVGSAFMPGMRLKAQATRVVEDPSDRDSKQSYFIQLADLNAYAALRWLHPTTKQFGQEMWDELGAARLLAVNKLRGGPQATRPPGIKVYP